MSEAEPTVMEAIAAIGVAYATRDYETAENATLHVLGTIRKERSTGVRVHAE